jgi:hypothetical protein
MSPTNNSGLDVQSTDDLDAVMEDLGRYQEGKRNGEMAVLAEHLKVCPLCGAVNQMVSKKCFVCSWHGEFETNNSTVEKSLDELILKCPQLLQALLPAHVGKKNTSLAAKVKNWFSSRFARPKRIDLAI